MKYVQRLSKLGEYLKNRASSPLFVILLLASVSANWLMQNAQAAPFSGVSLQDSARIQLLQSPRPFMHNPYAGNEAFKSRVYSYFDHDKPWYASDNVFVRYDGKRWGGSNASILSCQGRLNCYDGHDGYDLDLWFEPVLSSAAGKVVRAGWYNALNHSAAYGLWVAIDHGNGMATAYGHLSTLTVSVNQRVGTQWQIGTSGTSGSSTGPHLHFSTYYYPSWKATDPSGWRGKYADPNTVPDRYLWSSETAAQPVPILSSKGKQVYPGALLVDDNGPDWSTTGHWHSAKAASDIGGQLHWTSTTSQAASATASWKATMPVAGYYQVGVFVNDNHASSGWASYTIYSADPAHPDRQIKKRVAVDQAHIGVFQSPFGHVNTRAQWISLGTYYFTAERAGRVVLSNATGEDGLQVAADGVEFAPLVPFSYLFALNSDTIPAQMISGSSATVQLSLRNNGNFPWKTTGSRAVHLVYRWLDSHKHILSTSAPISLADDLAMNGTQKLSVTVQAPAQAGTYTLQWDLVQARQSFSKMGAKPRNDTVEVLAPTAPAS